MKTWLVEEDGAVSSSPLLAQSDSFAALCLLQGVHSGFLHTSGASQALAAALTTLDTTERQGCCGYARLGRCKGGVRAAPALGPVSAGLGLRPRPYVAGAPWGSDRHLRVLAGVFQKATCCWLGLCMWSLLPVRLAYGLEQVRECNAI